MVTWKYILVVLVALQGCQSSKTASQQQNSSSNIDQSNMKKALVVANGEQKPCPYLLYLEDEELLLDPINLDDSFKINGQKTWVAYTTLRMMSRCPDTMPIRIESIKKREEN